MTTKDAVQTDPVEVPTPGRIVIFNTGTDVEVLRPAVVVRVVDPDALELELHVFFSRSDFPLPAAVRLLGPARGSDGERLLPGAGTTVVAHAGDGCASWRWPVR